MIFKALAESERHSNLLEIVQNITIDQSNDFPEKFLFYIFSRYDVTSIHLEYRSRKTIPIRSMLDGKIREIALLEYLKNGQSLIIADEILFDPGEIKTLSDRLIQKSDAYYCQQNLTIPFFGDLHYRAAANPIYPCGGNLDLRFIRHNKITNWSSTIKILLEYIDKSQTTLTDQNLDSLKMILSEMLLIDLSDETNVSFMENIKEYNKLIEMMRI